MFGLFKSQKEKAYAVELAEVTYTYIERAEGLFDMFILDNGLELTDDCRKEIAAILFNIYRLGFVLSKFSETEKQLAITKLLGICFLQSATSLNLDVDPDFFVDRAKLYDTALLESGYQYERGPVLLAQFISVCRIEQSKIMQSFRDMASTLSELIRTAVLRNNDLAKRFTIVDEKKTGIF